jgi:hypothetical protein
MFPSVSLMPRSIVGFVPVSDEQVDKVRALVRTARATAGNSQLVVHQTKIVPRRSFQRPIFEFAANRDGEVRYSIAFG